MAVGGTFHYFGSAPPVFGPSWEDLRFPASAINPPGQASDPDFDTTNGAWLFASSGTEILYLTAQLPHSWQLSPLHPHVHWYKTTSASGDVHWRLEYKWCCINETMDAAFTTLDATSPVTGTPDTDTAQKHLITSFDDIDGTDKGWSDMLVMKLSRMGSESGDTYGADAALLEFDIHFQYYGLASNPEYPTT